MRNPGGLTPTGDNWEGWEQTVLIEGESAPDVGLQFVTMTDPNGVDYDVLVTAELWGERIMLYYVRKDAPGGWSDPANIESTIIDDGAGTPFDSQALDLDGDGKKSLANST